MDINAIAEEFEGDIVVNRESLLSEQVDNTKIQSKYLRYWIEAKRNRRNLEAAFSRLRAAKYDYFAGIPNPDNENRVSPIKRSTKDAIERSVESDPEVIASLKALDYAKSCVETLDFMLRAFKDRGYHIGAAIKMKIFEGGG